MKRIILLLFFPFLLISQIPQTLNYQGLLKDNNGNPVTDGNYSVVFSIYDVATNGTSLWSESRTITTSNGFFNLTLGENTPIIIQTDKQLWLNVNVGGTDLSPRTKLSSTLSAMNARQIENSVGAGNSVVSAINSSAGGISSEKIGNGNVSDSELEYLDGVTANLQTQIDSKQTQLPDQTGNSGKYLSTDGTNLSWEEVSGGGASSDVELFTMSSDISVDSDQFIDIISADLEANSSYKVRGVVGIARIGGDSQILFKMDYSGTSFMNYFDVKYVIVGANGESTTYKLLINSKDYVFEAFIRTTSAGTYKVQIAKTNAGNDDSTVLSGSKFIISKTD